MNDKKTQKVHAVSSLVEEELNKVMTQGFFGKVGIVVTIHDGGIQEVEVQITRKHR